MSKLGRDGRRRTLDVAPRGTIAWLRLVRGTVATWTSGGVERKRAAGPVTARALLGAVLLLACVGLRERGADVARRIADYGADVLW